MIKLYTDRKPITLQKFLILAEEGLIEGYESLAEFDPHVIEAILCEAYQPHVLVSKDDQGNWFVLYGMRIVRNVLQFMQNHEKLHDLNLIPELNGHDYDSMPPVLWNKLNDSILQIQSLTPSYDWNTKEELRKLFISTIDSKEN